MKNNRLTVMIASAILLTSVGTCTLAVARPSSGVAQAERSTPKQTKPAPSPNDPDWQSEFAGIDLSREQVSRIRGLKVTPDKEVFGPGFSLDQLIEWGRTGTQGEQKFKQSPIANAIRKYNAGIKEVLTPTQYQQWSQNGGGER